MLDPDVRRVLDTTALAHLATVLPDGSPHVVPVWIGVYKDRIAFFTGPTARKSRNLRRDPRVALSMTAPDNAYAPLVVRGRVVEWRDGEAGWAVVDAVAAKYGSAPYPREEERIGILIEPDVQRVGLG